MKKGKHISVLWQLASKFLELSAAENEIVVADVDIVGKSGKIRHLDFFVGEMIDDISFRRGMGVLIKDWKIPCNILEIKRGGRKWSDCPEINKILIIANSFSKSAKNLAQKQKIRLLTKDLIAKEIQSSLVARKKDLMKEKDTLQKNRERVKDNLLRSPQ
ncbi:MAG: hypothetical protein ACFFBD_14095 [Candidatus Hodarchaeota archaeon]